MLAQKAISSASYLSLIHESSTEVSRPPEYARTIFILVLRFINTTTFAARDFRPRRGARCFRTGTSAYPSAVCKERATTSGPKRTAARRGASLFGSGFVALLPPG